MTCNPSIHVTHFFIIYFWEEKRWMAKQKDIWCGGKHAAKERLLAREEDGWPGREIGG